MEAIPRAIALPALAAVSLNLADALLTVHHFQLGAVEMNPLMRALLEQGPLSFVLAKHFIVGAGVVVLAARRGRPVGELLRLVVLPVYACVALYQVALLAPG